MVGDLYYDPVSDREGVMIEVADWPLWSSMCVCSLEGDDGRVWSAHRRDLMGPIKEKTCCPTTR